MLGKKGVGERLSRLLLMNTGRSWSTNLMHLPATWRHVINRRVGYTKRVIPSRAERTERGVRQSIMSDHDNHYEAVAKVYSMAVFYDASGPFVKWLKERMSKIME